jgi:hypothetical protein
MFSAALKERKCCRAECVVVAVVLLEADWLMLVRGCLARDSECRNGCFALV